MANTPGLPASSDPPPSHAGSVGNAPTAAATLPDIPRVTCRAVWTVLLGLRCPDESSLLTSAFYAEKEKQRKMSKRNASAFPHMGLCAHGSWPVFCGCQFAGGAGGGGRTRTSREEHVRPLDRHCMESKSRRGRGQRARRDSVRPGALQSTQDTHMYGPIRGDIITPLLRQRSEARDKWWVQKHGPASDEAGVTALLTPKLPPGFGLG